MAEMSRGFNFDDFSEQVDDALREYEESKTAMAALEKAIAADFEHVAYLHGQDIVEPPTAE